MSKTYDSAYHRGIYERRRDRNAARKLTAKGKPYTRGPYKTSRVSQADFTPRLTKAERFVAQGLTTRGTVPVVRGSLAKKRREEEAQERTATAVAAKAVAAAHEEAAGVRGR